MRIRERDDILQVDEVPGLHWMFGALFVAVGAIFVAGPLGLFGDADRIRWPLRIAMAAMGSIGVATGVWSIANAPRTRLVIDRAAALIRLSRWGLRGRTVQTWPLDALAAVQLAESRDSDGDTVFRLVLVLRNTEPQSLSPVWRHGRDEQAALARRLAEWAEVRATNA